MTMPRCLSSRWDVVGGQRMHSVQAIASPGVPSPGPVVVVHGLGMSSRYLTPTLEVLARDHEVYAPDLPGCGRSSRPDRPLPLGALAAAVVGWMDAVRIDRPVLIGHSIGCQVVAHLAELHPDRVAGLVLASPTGDPSTGRYRQAAALVADAAREAPRLIPVAALDYLRAGPIRMWHTFELSRRNDTIEQLRRLRQRCLVVRGGDDAVVSAAWGRAVSAAVGAEQLVTIPQAPHGLPFSAAPSLASAINEFLAP